MTFSIKKNITTILFLLFLIISAKASAQEMDKPEVNGFTNEVTPSTTKEEIASSSDDSYASDYLWAYFTVKSGNNFYFYLRTDAQYEKRDSYTINKGYKLYLKLKNDSLITFSNAKDVTASAIVAHDHYDRLTYWSAYSEYHLSCDDIIKLSNSDFTGVRVETNNGPLDFGMKPKESKILKKLAGLILDASNCWRGPK